MLRLLFLLFLMTPLAALSQDGPPVFEVESLNPGLDDPPDWMDRSTPQGTLEALLFAEAAEDWQAAAHLLDLGDIAPEEQEAAGARLAEDLRGVLDRKVVINWSDLPDRPDAVIEPEGDNGSVALTPRRSIRLWTLELENRPVPIRINRVQAAGEEPVWVFSRQTVRNIPALRDLYRPSALEQSIPNVLRQKGLWGLQLWELIALPLVLLMAGAVGYAVFNGLKRLAKGPLDGRGGRLALAARGPLALAAVTFVLATLGQSILVFSGRIDAFVTPAIALGYVGAVFWLIVSLGDAILDRVITLDGTEYRGIGEGLEDQRRVATRIVALRRAVLVLVTLAGLGIVVTSTNLMGNLGLSVLASAGALTIVLGFAARNILSNIMSSMQIAINGSAKIGDKLLYEGRICTVERIHFTYVQLLIWTGERMVVPVNEFVDTPFENWTMKDPSVVRQVVLKLAHTFDPERLRDAYERILGEIDAEDAGPEEDRGIHVTGQDVFGQDVMFLIPCTNPNTAWEVECTVRRKLLLAAAELQEDGKPVFPEAQAAEAA